MNDEHEDRSTPVTAELVDESHFDGMAPAISARRQSVAGKYRAKVRAQRIAVVAVVLMAMSYPAFRLGVKILSATLRHRESPRDAAPVDPDYPYHTDDELIEELERLRLQQAIDDSSGY